MSTISLAHLFTYAAAALLLTATLLPLWRLQFWWVRGFDFPRQQLLCLTAVFCLYVVLMLESGTTGYRLLLSCLFFCLVYQTCLLIPFTPLGKKDIDDAAMPDADNTLSLLLTNVLMSNRHSQALIDLVATHQPDLILTMETDQRWQDALAELTEDYPYCVACPQDNLYGMHLFSRLPLAETRVEHLVEPSVPSIHTLVNLPSGAKVRAHFLHPAPPSPTENPGSHERDAELVVVAKSLETSDQATLVAGDFNATSWSGVVNLFRRISALGDPRRGREILSTFHADFWFARWPLDHILLSRQFQVGALRRVYLKGSDHFALLGTFVYRPDAAPAAENGLARTDKLRAEKLISAQDVSDEIVPQPGERDS